MDAIKIVLADAHTLFREGLKRIVAGERDLLVTAEASRTEDVEPAVAKGKGDVLLLDVEMPGREAIQTLLQVREEHPETRTVILTAHEDGDRILDTAKAGARGYLLKDVTPETLFQAVRTVHGGGVWIDPKLPRAGDFCRHCRPVPSRAAGGGGGRDTEPDPAGTRSPDSSWPTDSATKRSQPECSSANARSGLT